MRRLHPWTTVVWLGTAATGCAAITGLDSIQEQDCTPFCGDGQVGADPGIGGEGMGERGDATMNVVPGSGDASQSPNRPDGLAGTDASSGLLPQAEASSWADVRHEASLVDAGTADAATDARLDGPVDVHVDVQADGQVDAASVDSPSSYTMDGGAEAEGDGFADAGGCGQLNSVMNCTACGQVCTPVGATKPECTGTTCSYTCNPGYLDCNAATSPPDTDGCECHAPGASAAQCCAGACPIAHNYDEDLTDGAFYDCVAAGTYNGTLAKDACAAYAGAGNCDAYECDDADGGVISHLVCSDGPGAVACACWAYDGDLQGQMVVGPGTAAAGAGNCLCPQTTDPQWR
jgi:hypothetical protein